MTEIEYIKADATLPQSEGNIIITHICNDIGAVQFVQVEELIWVANIIGQHKIRKDEKGLPPIRYEAVREALTKVAIFAKEKQAHVQMPRIGCGLAGGSWEEIALIIENTLLAKDIPVTVCDF